MAEHVGDSPVPRAEGRQVKVKASPGVALVEEVVRAAGGHAQEKA